MLLLLADAAQQTTISVTDLDPTSFTWWLKNFGPTGVLLFFMGLGFWKICLFLKPYVIRFFNSHDELIQSTIKNQAVQSADIHELKLVQSNHSIMLREVHQTVVPIEKRSVIPPEPRTA